MQPRPGGSNLDIKLGTVIKSILFVAVIGVIYFIVEQEVGTFFAWSVVFLILINVYLVYRMSIRRSLNEKLFGDPTKDTSGLSSQQVPQSSSLDLEQQQTNFNQFQSDYDRCPDCDAELIPELSYCEECGRHLA